MLFRSLVREVPEAMKPKKIQVGGQRKLEVVQDEANQADAA